MRRGRRTRFFPSLPIHSRAPSCRLLSGDRVGNHIPNPGCPTLAASLSLRLGWDLPCTTDPLPCPILARFPTRGWETTNLPVATVKWTPPETRSSGVAIIMCRGTGESPLQEPSSPSPLSRHLHRIPRPAATSSGRPPHRIRSLLQHLVRSRSPHGPQHHPLDRQAAAHPRIASYRRQTLPLHGCGSLAKSPQ